MEKESKDWRKKQQRFYKSKKWQYVRELRILKDNNVCQICGEFIRNGRAIVHHKIHLNESNIDNPKIALNLDNLITVCNDCHEKEHPDRFGVRKKAKDSIVKSNLEIDYSKRRKEVRRNGNI